MPHVFYVRELRRGSGFLEQCDAREAGLARVF